MAFYDRPPPWPAIGGSRRGYAPAIQPRAGNYSRLATILNLQLGFKRVCALRPAAYDHRQNPPEAKFGMKMALLNFSAWAPKPRNQWGSRLLPNGNRGKKLKIEI